ncbi:(R,S)-reticuline 7-O-methyltransferase-like [Pistacia vera]|uniref:(R,S)-reticuline 7-O-methyltransferase-like n=1 Tax=Pistacia vera TaxID=55513 RepID=UPI0012635C88|nr:(R,S)-reticuline 7-O-methyltransferase-like [Pistacia vera]
MEAIETSDESLRGQVEIWQHMFSFADSMALKCAVELRIADIINTHCGPITLSQLASSIGSPFPGISYLSRIMRLLVRKKIFAAYHDSNGNGETLYGLTHSSRWLLRDSELSLAPMILMENHPLLMAPWHCFSQCVKEGGIAFKIAHGKEIWDFALQNPEFNKLFNDGLACTSKIIARAIISGYKDGFSSINGSLVDVGGGTGELINEIVKSYPHIRGINFDLPHVVSTAPKFDGISHVDGDMFQAIPKADAAIMKFVLHDWSDEDCVKILRNCRNAIPEKTGKVLITEVIVKPDGNDLSDDTGLDFDLLMIAHSTGGKERTEVEWKKILEEAGFPQYNIINIPAIPFIIEAFPQ